MFDLIESKIQNFGIKFCRVIAIAVLAIVLPLSAASAASCKGATNKLVSLQRKTVQLLRNDRVTERELRKVQRDFSKAYKQRKKWRKKVKSSGCNKKGANHRICAKAEREDHFWTGQMRKLQREENKLLRSQRKANAARKKEWRAEKARRTACRGLPAPRRPRKTIAEAGRDKIARDIFIGVAIGVLGRIAGRRSGGNNCRNNPLGANC